MMTRNNGFVFVFIIGLFFLQPIISPLFAQTPPDSQKVFVEDLKGDVQVIKAGDTKSRQAVKGDPITTNDKVQVGKGGSANIMIEGLGEIQLDEETSWSYEKFTLEEDKRIFYANLALGKLKARVKPLPPGSVFEIKTPVSIAAVRGTFFGLFVYMVQQQIFALLEVFEDSVVFSNLARDQSLIVNEGESARGEESGKIARVSDEDKKAGGGPPSGGSSDGGTKDPFDGYPPGPDNFFNREAPTTRPEPMVYTHPGQTGSSSSSGDENHYHSSE